MKWAGLAADQLHHFCLSAIRPMLEYCCVVWHRGLTKTGVEQLEAIQRHAIRIVFEVTPNVPYQSAVAHTHTPPFNGPLSGTTWVGRYQKGKTNLDFTEARDSEWQ